MNSRTPRRLIALSVLVLCSRPSQGGEPRTRLYDGLDASAESHAFYEADRLWQINRQLSLVNRMRFNAALSRSGDRTMLYGLGNTPPGIYDHALNQLWLATPQWFEPWISAPGDIWGYDFLRPIRQPIGQRQIQTGPNRWESHPVFAGEPAVRRDGPREF